MVTQSSILAWKIPRPEKPGRLQSMSHKESDTTEHTHTHTHTHTKSILFTLTTPLKVILPLWLQWMLW